MSQDDLYYVNKIVKDLMFVIKYTNGITQEELENNELLVDSVMFRLIQISENSQKLTDQFKMDNADIPWRAIKGLRNRIVHEYGDVDLTVIYETVVNDLPDLSNKLQRLK